MITIKKTFNERKLDSNVKPLKLFTQIEVERK